MRTLVAPPRPPRRPPPAPPSRLLRATRLQPHRYKSKRSSLTPQPTSTAHDFRFRGGVESGLSGTRGGADGFAIQRAAGDTAVEAEGDLWTPVGAGAGVAADLLQLPRLVACAETGPRTCVRHSHSLILGIFRRVSMSSTRG